MDACHDSGYDIEIFIDDEIATEESFKKWQGRMEREVEEERKDVPYCFKVIIGDMFKNMDVKVHYSSIDNDDTLAAYAYHDNAAILSNDQDFFRYFIYTDEARIYK